MITVFRRIRQKLANDNQFLKYSRYAIGEIVLVVIGILIALQINNWNSQRKARNREQLFIEQLTDDLRTTVIEVKDIISYFQDRAVSSGKVIHAFYKPEAQNDSIIIHIFSPWSYRSYFPVMGSAKALVNSGNIELIKSPKVRSAIITYIETIEAYIEDVHRYEQSYYRKSIASINSQISISSFMADGYKKRGLRPYGQSEFGKSVNSIPTEFDQFPFPVTLDDFFGNEHVFRSYEFLLISHRNTFYIYQRLLTRTENLLSVIEEEGYNVIEKPHVTENRDLVFDSIDLKILQSANILLSDSSKWNNQDDRKCQNDIVEEKYSLFCALYRASIDVTREYKHRRAAIQLVRFETEKIGDDREIFAHRLKEWNNHPKTTFEDVKKVLNNSIKIIEKQLSEKNE